MNQHASDSERFGARGGTRTPTPLLASGPKPGASTNFAILASEQTANGPACFNKSKGRPRVKTVALHCQCVGYSTSNADFTGFLTSPPRFLAAKTIWPVRRAA